MKWMRVEKMSPREHEPILLCINNRIDLGFFHKKKYWTEGEVDFVMPTHWCYIEDVPLPIKDCQNSCELCKNRHEAYHIPK